MPVKNRRPASYYREWRKRTKPHRHQRMTARVIRGICQRLKITHEVLGEYIGVGRISILRWANPQGRLSHPSIYQWRRIREMWFLAKYTETPEFWEDRIVPPRFDQ